MVSSADWKLDPEELASKFNSKTKAIVVNNPNNPLGKIFTRAELEMIAALCIKHDVLVFSDEVYEFMVYKPNEHIRIATLPGMWERTVTIGSAGKAFSVTGWKIGWSIGPKHLIKALCVMHQNCVYTCSTPIQEAVAVGFETELPRVGTPQCYWNELPLELLPKRDKMAALLVDAGLTPVVPEAGYFMVADISKLSFPEDKSSTESHDYQFVKWMTKNMKLATIPVSVFYTDAHKHLASNLVRFCFMKEDSTLEKAAVILKEFKASL
jgi:kynurenine--oxoglutarate transaminase/cysteine-S-conjugate beta-lyase/glutamine--phenylpyruvate transaminase